MPLSQLARWWNSGRSRLGSRKGRARGRTLPRKTFQPRIQRPEDRLAPATVTFTNPNGGYWEDPANWSTGALPGPNDTAVINLNGIAVTYSSADSTLVTGLTLSGRNSSLEVSEGTLHASGTAAMSNTFMTIVDGGTLIGQTAFNVTGASLKVYTGTVSAPGDNLTVTGGSTLGLYGGTVPYTTTIVSSTLDLGDSSTTGAGTINVQGTSTLIGSISMGQTVVLQGSSAGSARLNVSGGASNAGTIQLNVSGGNGSSSTLAVTGSGAFTNAATGVIRAAYTGGVNNGWAITGNLTNQGQIVGASTAALPISGGVFEEAGGSVGTNAWLQGISFRVTAPPADHSGIALRGTCTLLGDTPAGTFLDVQAAGSSAQLDVSGGASNAGTIQLNVLAGNGTASTLAVTGGGTFTNAATGVIRAAYTGGVNNGWAITGNLTNQGQIVGASTAALPISGGVFEEAGGSVGTNAWLQGISFRVTAPPADHSGIALRGTCTLLGDTPAGTFLDVQATASSAQLDVSGGASNAGTIQLNVLAGNGSSSTLAVTGGGAFTNAATGVIRAVYTGEVNNGWAILGALVNDGALAVNSNITLGITGDSLTNQPGGVITGSGTINLSGSGGAPLMNLGTIQVTAGNALTIRGPFLNFSSLDQRLTGGTYDVTGSLRFDGASIMTNAATIILTGPGAQILPTSGSTSALANFATNRADGSFTARNGFNFTTASGVSTFDNEGMLTAGQGSTFRVLHNYTQGSAATLFVDRGRMRIDGSFTNVAAGTLTGGQYQIIGTDAINIGVLQFSGADIATNAATLELDGPDAQIIDESQTPLDGLRDFSANNGSFTIADGFNFATAGDFTNNGTLTIAPGVFAVQGSYSQGSSGVLSIALDGTSPGSGYGQLTASGTATLAAGAGLSTQLGFVSTNGDTFTVLSAAGGVNGSFNGLPDGSAFVLSGERFRINYPAGGVVLTHFANVATHLNFIEPATVTAGIPFNITVQALDGNNNLDTGYTGTVQFVATNGAMPRYTFTPGDQGQHTFTLTLYRAGTLGVTGTDTVTGITGSTSFTVVPAAADHLVFLQQPTDTVAGQTMSPVVVAVVDQYGNVETGDNSDLVTLSIGNNPGGGTLTGTLTMTVVNGVATFSDLSIDQVGMDYTLHASVGNGLADIDSDPFNITP